MRSVLAAIVLLGLSAPTAMAAASAGEALSRIKNPDWAQRPSGDDIARHYPIQAIRKGLEGQAVIQCSVRIDGHLTDCVVVSESPQGAGFGAATLALAGEFRMTPQIRDGVAVDGASVTIPVVYKLPEVGPDPTVEEMQKEAFESVRQTFTPSPRDSLGAMAGLAGVLLLAMLLDWPARGRRQSQADLASVLASGLAFVGVFWRRATLPALVYVAVVAGLQLLRYGSAEAQFIAMPAAVVVSFLGVLLVGAGWRLVLKDHGAGQTLAFRPPGLHLGRPELWSFLAPLVLGLIVMFGLLFVFLVGVVLWIGGGLVPAVAAERELVSWTLAGLGLGGALFLGAKLWLLTPISILKNDLAFTEAWRATRGMMWPIVPAMLLLQLITAGPTYALTYFAGGMPPIWSEPVFDAPWMVFTALSTVITVAFGVPLMIGMKAALVPRGH